MDPEFASACTEDAATGLSGCGADQGQAEGGLVGAGDLDLFSAAGGGEEVVEVLLSVLGANLHRLRVEDRGGGVNGIAGGSRGMAEPCRTRKSMVPLKRL